MAEWKRLELDTRLILRNQHAIMSGLENILLSGVMFDTRTVPLLRHQIDETDDAIGKNRVKDD